MRLTDNLVYTGVEKNKKKNYMRTEGSHKAVAFSAIVFMLFGGYFAYAAFLTGQPASVPFVQPATASDDEDGSDDSGDEDKDEDEDEDKDDDSQSEKQKKEDEKKREDAKKATERAREAAKRSFNDDDELDDNSDDENEVEDEDELENEDELDDDSKGNGDREAMFKDRNKTMEKLNEKIAEAEKHILEKQAEGVDVTAALAQLSLAKAGMSAVDAAFTANELDQVKALAKSAEKLAHFSQGKTLHDSEESAKDIAKVAKRINQTKEKIALLAQLGGDTSVYIASLQDAEAAFADAKAQIAAGGDGLLAGLSALDTVERRVKTIKHSVEGALYALGASDDDEFENDHDAEVEDVSDDLSELADADEDHSALRTLVRAHKSEAKKVSTLVKDLDDRNAIARGLFGNDGDVLNALRSEVAVNEARIAAMQAAADQIEDNELNLLVNEKIAELKSENMKLMGFVTSQSINTGVLGWLFRLF